RQPVEQVREERQPHHRVHRHHPTQRREGDQLHGALHLVVTSLESLLETASRPSLAGHSGHCPITSGNPFLVFPMTTILVFWLSARRSVASIPFHVSRSGLIPCATVF